MVLETAVSPRNRFRVRLGFVTGCLALASSWLMFGEGSPLEAYFSGSAAANWWANMNLVPGLVAMIASGNIHGGDEATFYLCAFAQWFLVGVILASLVLSLPGD